MLKQLVCKAVGHHPWVHSSVSVNEVDGNMEVTLHISYGKCKRCSAALPEVPREFLAFRFHPAEVTEVKLTQNIDRFEHE